MREVVGDDIPVYLKENLPLPDLIVIDGGKGQMEAAREIIEDELGLIFRLRDLQKMTNTRHLNFYMATHWK